MELVEVRTLKLWLLLKAHWWSERAWRGAIMGQHLHLDMDVVK